MGINGVLANLPSLVASVYDQIILIDEKKEKVYQVLYNGEQIHVLSPIKMEELSNLIQNEAILSLIKSSDEVKDVIDDKFVVVTKNDDFKVLMIGNISKNVEIIDNVINDKPTILIADDSEIIIKFFTKIFKDEYNVIVANDGEEAIELVEKNKNELVGAFIDLNMPKKTGYEVLDYFKENSLFSGIPVSIISGEDTSDGIKKALDFEGVIDMLQKPFSKEDAHAIVKKTISFSNKVN